MSFNSVEIQMLDGSKSLRFCEWNDSAAPESEENKKRLKRLGEEVPTAIHLGQANGTLGFSFAETEVCFILTTGFVSKTERNKQKRKDAQQCAIVGLLREIVVANLNGQNGEPQVVPKFGVAPSGKSELLRIRNYGRYIEWCTLLRDQVTRTDGVDSLIWTPLLQSGMEEIYDLKPIGEVPSHKHLISIA